MLRQELDIGYFKWIHKPGADLERNHNACILTDEWGGLEPFQKAYGPIEYME